MIACCRILSSSVYSLSAGNPVKAVVQYASTRYWSTATSTRQHAELIARLRESLPLINFEPLPGSRGADYPLYEG